MHRRELTLEQDALLSFTPRVRWSGLHSRRVRR